MYGDAHLVEPRVPVPVRAPEAWPGTFRSTTPPMITIVGVNNIIIGVHMDLQCTLLPLDQVPVLQMDGLVGWRENSLALESGL